jgi:hypothetical protein
MGFRKKQKSVFGFQELAEGPLLSYDPLPPTNSIDIYKKSATNANNVFDDPSAFRMFFR